METGVERQGIQEQDMQGRYMQELFRMQEVDIKEYSPLALAYIGDAVYELIIRSLVLNEGNRQVQKMHAGFRSGENYYCAERSADGGGTRGI